MGRLVDSGVPQSGVRQIPSRSISSQSSPSWIVPLTPMESIMRVFLVGRSGSMGGRVSGLVNGSGEVAFGTVVLMVAASAWGVLGDRR